MLIVYQPENDSMDIHVHDTSDGRTFYTDEAEIIINLVGAAGKLDDFVGLSRKQKEDLVIHNLSESKQVEALIDTFKKC